MRRLAWQEFRCSVCVMVSTRSDLSAGSRATNNSFHCPRRARFCYSSVVYDVYEWERGPRWFGITLYFRIMEAAIRGYMRHRVALNSTRQLLSLARNIRVPETPVITRTYDGTRARGSLSSLRNRNRWAILNGKRKALAIGNLAKCKETAVHEWQSEKEVIFLVEKYMDVRWYILEEYKESVKEIIEWGGSKSLAWKKLILDWT